jgi:predicted adenylyl cyclase CyaB
MNILNIEIKATTDSPQKIEEILNSLNARYEGVDHQIDTYFSVDSGRLKLREGNIEKSLILYHRKEIKGLKKSEVVLQKFNSELSGLKSILQTLLKTQVIVEKYRKIFFIENVKFHIDEVKDLGFFIEIEAIDETGNLNETQLREQCSYYIDLFGIKNTDLIDKSYCDMKESE